MNIIKFFIKHFKTFSFFFGFALDLFFLPKTTSPHYIYVGPIDISIVLLFVIIRQLIRKNLLNKNRKIKKDFKNIKEKSENHNEEEVEKIINSVEDLKTKGHKFLEKLESWSTYTVSFFLGTLLSHVLVYYFWSSDVFQMWPIFLIVALTILANEFLYGTVPDLLLFYIGITFFTIFNVPIFLNKVNNNTFLISIMVSLIITSVLTIILQRIYLSLKEFILLIIFSVFFPFLLLRLYYINYIPAVPLALGDSDFYSYVAKQDNGEYFKDETGKTLHKKLFLINDNFFNIENVKNKGIYFFSSIVSPADVTAQITHVWERYDYDKKIWNEVSRVTYPVFGGREGGYRGYSLNQSISRGKWRVRVLADDRLVGLKEINIK